MGTEERKDTLKSQQEIKLKGKLGFNENVHYRESLSFFWKFAANDP